ncbi:osteocrin isoform X1 [Natator depressus]|uniref:osteocrin isoform X1 n=1 Tax=Natator depressus TaxID=27790 RepID=UPI003EBA8B33
MDRLHRAGVSESHSKKTTQVYEGITHTAEMLQVRFGVVHFVLALTLLQWPAGTAVLAEAAPQKHQANPSPLPLQPFDSSIVLGMEAHSTSSEEKSATDLAAKLLLLDELVSLENDVIETKKKRSFPGFGSPLDRLSASSVDLKGKQRKVVELPKRRFGIPLDRIGKNRLASTRG